MRLAFDPAWRRRNVCASTGSANQELPQRARRQVQATCCCLCIVGAAFASTESAGLPCSHPPAECFAGLRAKDCQRVCDSSPTGRLPAGADRQTIGYGPAVNGRRVTTAVVPGAERATEEHELPVADLRSARCSRTTSPNACSARPSPMPVTRRERQPDKPPKEQGDGAQSLLGRKGSGNRLQEHGSGRRFVRFPDSAIFPDSRLHSTRR